MAMGEPEQIVAAVRELAVRRLEGAVGHLVGSDELAALAPGKMLRTRLAARLACTPAVAADSERVERACAAVEIVHTASLSHDDVIDGGTVRRGRPTLWRTAGRRGAILIGDMLLCAAFELVTELGAEATCAFAAAVREVAEAEASHELAAGRTEMTDAGRVELARAKTGPLFAFPAWSCAGRAGRLRDAVQEAGYRIGAAYQIADDLLDATGREGAAGKTLGTDALRGKATLASAAAEGDEATHRQMRALCRAALDALEDWPDARAAVGEFLALDLQPVLDRHLPGLQVAGPAHLRSV
jgi:geranylgeranyl pyrophosphate synthase